MFSDGSFQGRAMFTIKYQITEKVLFTGSLTKVR